MANVTNYGSYRCKCSHHELPCHILWHGLRLYNLNIVISVKGFVTAEQSRAAYIQVKWLKVKANVAEISEKNGYLTVCFMQTYCVLATKWWEDGKKWCKLLRLMWELLFRCFKYRKNSSKYCYQSKLRYSGTINAGKKEQKKCADTSSLLDAAHNTVNL